MKKNDPTAAEVQYYIYKILEEEVDLYIFLCFLIIFGQKEKEKNTNVDIFIVL